MPKNREVFVGSRETIIGLLVGKHGIREITRMLSLLHSTVSYIVRKWRRLGTTENLKRSGHPSHVTDRDLENLSEPLERISPLFNQNRDDPLSMKTISRKMHSIQSSGSLQKTLISAKNRKKRLA